MNKPPLQRWSVRLALLVVGVAACVALYVKTRAVDFGAHAELIDSLRRVQQLNAVLQQEVLASRFGLLNQYDALARTEAESTEALSALTQQLARLSYQSAATQSALDRLSARKQLRTQDLEHFKTQNAVLKNSLYYLPTAGDALIAELERAELPASAEFSAHVHGIVQSTLLHNLLKSDSLRERIDSAFSRSDAFAAGLPAAAAAQYRLLLQHARTVLRQQDLVDPLTSRMISSDFDGAALQLAETYTRSFETAVESANRYRIALYASVVVLLFAVCVIGIKLRELYANLETMVSDRTQRLEQALKELWGEMELAKKIQTALVPAQPTLENCDVAAIMRPADQVGGDYYDVVTIGGNEWVLIGDVSGHGVPAGLVMMMCQTAVHTALELDASISPQKLLATVNRSLTANIRRLGEDKYMTINAFCRRPNGQFEFSGMHQDILIYRAQSGAIEEIPAEGMCLGLAPSIDDQLAIGSFTLGEGDVLLLYTDGVTEAKRDGRMLDAAGLKALLCELGPANANQIVDGIMARLSDYTISDDVTALAIKQARVNVRAA